MTPRSKSQSAGLSGDLSLPTKAYLPVWYLPAQVVGVIWSDSRNGIKRLDANCREPALAFQVLATTTAARHYGEPQEERQVPVDGGEHSAHRSAAAASL